MSSPVSHPAELRVDPRNDPRNTSLQLLIANAARGDHTAFSMIYERTHAHLFGVAMRILGEGQAAEDALQEAYVSIWKNAASYKSEIEGQAIAAMTWLIAIVRNKALDALRVRNRTRTTSFEDFLSTSPDTLEEHSDQAPSAMQLLERATQSMNIEQCLNVLNGSHRQCLALAYYQGMSHTEVAEQMDAPLGSVKAWIRRGLEKLKGCLAAQGVVA
jgi:RNA polymerase sigma-70 factor, ECF subfamily